MISLTDIRARVASGALRPDAAIAASLAAVEDREPEIGAFVHVDRDARAGGEGPLRGVAVAMKDIVDTADMPTTMGSAIYAGWRPKADAAIVSALKAAGATILGKSTTTAFAYLDPTPTRNPANPAHTPGGSSAGSAAAVAAGMVPLAIGTQTGGSIIRPASYCGVAGIKPSFRLIPTVGVKCYAWTLDTVGLFAAGVADLAAALEILTGRTMTLDGGDGLRFGIARQPFAGPVGPECVTALDGAAAALARAGHVVVDVVEPGSLAEAWAVHPTIQGFEAKAALAWEWRERRADLPALLGAELDAAQAITAADYDAARRLANRARRGVPELFGEVDAILTYAAPGAAPRGLGSTGEARFNRLFTLLGTPCVNVPGVRDNAGMPVGIQVVAPFARDAIALAAAARLEAVLAGLA